MKKIYLSLLLIGFISVSFAQQIPFQGRLLEAGVPVEGTRDFAFSIDVDGNVWTESHLGVPVSEGLYYVVLGSITPLPADLFKGVDSRDMDISVNGSPMSPIQVFAPPTSYYFGNDDPADSRPAILAQLNGNITGWAAIEGESYTDTDATGVYGNAQSAVSGSSLGVYGRANGAGKYNKGLYGLGLGAGNGDTGTGFGEGSINFGMEGNAGGNAWNNTGVEGSNFGAEGQWNFGIHGISNAGTGPSVENHGVAGRAYGEGINYGVYGEASGGVTNYAGYFKAEDANADVNGGIASFSVPGPSGGNAVYGGMDISTSASTFSTSIFGVVNGAAQTPAAEFRGVQGQVITSGGASNTGVRAYAGGDGINKALFASAVNGTENWAGWFDGEVLINGNLTIPNDVGRGTGVFGDFDNGVVVNDGAPTLRMYSGSSENISFNADDGSGFFSGDLTVNGNTNFSQLFVETTTADNENIAMKAAATGPGNGDTGPGGSYNIGFRGDASNNGWGNVGVTGYATGTTGVNNSGGTFFSMVNDGTTTITNQGIYTEASGPGVNYGIFANAFGGNENWAGWFNGDVKITGNLDANLNLGTGAYTLSEKDWEPDNQGFLHLYGESSSGDNIRAALEVNGPLDNATGSLSLYGPVYNDGGCPTCPRSFVNLGMFNDAGGPDPSGWAGNMELYGTNSPNILMGAQSYINHDLPNITLFGNKPDGGGWFYSHANFGVNQDGTQQWGNMQLFANDGDMNFEIGAKSWEDAAVGAQRPYLQMQGSVNDDNMVWMEVFDVDGTNEAGGINFRSTDGAEFGINAYGLTGALNDLNINNFSSIGDVNDNSVQIDFQSVNIHKDWDATDNDNGWNVVSLNGNDNGSRQWGSLNLFADNDDLNVGIGAKEWEGPAGASRPYIQMQGSINDIDMIWLDVFDVDADGLREAGSISLSSTDGFNYNMNSYGINGVNFSTGIDGEGDGELNLSSTSATGIRMYGALDDGGGRRSHIALDGDAGEYVYLWGDGAIDASGSVSSLGDMFAPAFNITSDKRLKTNIESFDEGLATVLKLNSVEYNWKDQPEGDKEIGLIAQEVEEVLPEFVNERKDGYKAVNYAQMTAVLIEAIKELNEKIESLESENAELRASLNQAETNSEQIKALQQQIDILVALIGSGQGSDIQVSGEEK